MIARVDNFMRAAHQFVIFILRDITKFLVHMGDDATMIGDGHNRMRIDRQFVVFKNLSEFRKLLLHAVDQLVQPH